MDYYLAVDRNVLVSMETDADFLLSHNSLDQIISWAHQAGQIAMGYFKKVDPHLKSDKTFVTQADLEIEEFLANRIRSTYPSHKLIGEEGLWNNLDHPSPYIWVIDPIDGTTVFSQGLPGWGISVGLLKQGQPYFGLFYMPLLDDMTYAVHQRGVYSDTHNLTYHAVRREWVLKDFVAVSANIHRDYQIENHNTRALGSISASLVYTARGVAAGAFFSKARLWDLVAGAAILAEAGGGLSYLFGQSVDFLQLLDGRLIPEPIIAGHPDILADLRRLIAKIEGADRS